LKSTAVGQCSAFAATKVVRYVLLARWANIIFRWRINIAKFLWALSRHGFQRKKVGPGVNFRIPAALQMVEWTCVSNMHMYFYTKKLTQSVILEHRIVFLCTSCSYQLCTNCFALSYQLFLDRRDLSFLCRKKRINKDISDKRRIDSF